MVSGIIDAERKDGINLIALFDHEEIGSRSKQGAGSILLHDMLLRILKACGAGESAPELLYQSMLLSVDVAHGLHPNQAGKMDITNKPVLGSGFCIKEACSQSYATDCEAIAIIQQICDLKEVCEPFRYGRGRNTWFYCICIIAGKNGRYRYPASGNAFGERIDGSSRPGSIDGTCKGIFFTLRGKCEKKKKTYTA